MAEMLDDGFNKAAAYVAFESSKRTEILDAIGKMQDELQHKYNNANNIARNEYEIGRILFETKLKREVLMSFSH